MGDYWFAAGLLLSIFGPLLLVLPIAALYWLFRRYGLAQRLGNTQRGSAKAVHGLLALTSVAVVIVVTWLPGRLEFSRLCDELAEPRIYARVKAEGFYIDDLTANSFGQRYLRDEGFAWMEAKDIYHRGQFIRYRRDGSKIATDAIPALTATYVVSSGVEVRANSIHVARTEIAERVSGKILAEAHSVIFHGGPLGLFIGVYGFASCPHPITAEGSRQFNTYYHLVREVLGGGLPPVLRKPSPQP